MKDNCGWMYGAELDDDRISHCQDLIKKKYPHVEGLQNISVLGTDQFTVPRGEFVQILHTGADHWVTVSTIGCHSGEIFVYDSMKNYPTVSLRSQIAKLLHTPEDIDLNYIDVQQQQFGSRDCGAFAVAFATTLASGGRPEKCSYIQKDMRKHLLRCLQEKGLPSFPISFPISTTDRKDGPQVLIRCNNFIMCSKCPKGVLSVTAPGDQKQWFCSECLKKSILSPCPIIKDEAASMTASNSGEPPHGASSARTQQQEGGETGGVAGVTQSFKGLGISDKKKKRKDKKKI